MAAHARMIDQRAGARVGQALRAHAATSRTVRVERDAKMVARASLAV